MVGNATRQADEQQNLSDKYRITGNAKGTGVDDLADTGATVVVTANAVRLLTYRSKN
ncbi:hypothetical protein [Pararhizobium sp. A13]|uniref:hypothetical protein n=1 Tax=Pararhizobium sp. A13 TaxID=3133975 RepID=UPI00311AC9FA